MARRGSKKGRVTREKERERERRIKRESDNEKQEKLTRLTSAREKRRDCDRNYNFWTRREELAGPDEREDGQVEGRKI